MQLLVQQDIHDWRQHTLRDLLPQKLLDDATDIDALMRALALPIDAYKKIVFLSSVLS